MKKPSFRLWFVVVGVMLVLSVTYWAGCSRTPNEPTTQETVLSPTSSQALAVMAVQERYTDNLLAHPEVVGTATGLTKDGKVAILVMTKSDMSTKADVKIESLRKGVAPVAIPAAIEDLPVVVLVTGEIKALKGGPPGGSFDPTARHRPAPNGVSLGHPAITAGTLGCLVTNGSIIYILSNNHVMANSNNANIGDNILQPGPFDGGVDPDDRIADLSAFVTIKFDGSDNFVDAAIADVVNDADVTGATDPNAGSYGQPRSTTVSASVNMNVQKYGRTTQHTNGKVQAINATVNVNYGEESGVARFVNQIVIGGGNFSAGGDSGSLIVARGGSNDRKPVGLLFAGSSSSTIANPINAVLSAFSVTVVGD
ncbi:S1 family peptidase [candidate division KSB1 bacterium]|nr:S1 family peptidase [candidate division KSB1 bacterium]